MGEHAERVRVRSLKWVLGPPQPSIAVIASTLTAFVLVTDYTNASPVYSFSNSQSRIGIRDEIIAIVNHGFLDFFRKVGAGTATEAM